MIGFLQHLLAFVFALGVLITFHEYGHFTVARKFDVKILRFSIGFGRPLWKRRFGKDNTELVVAALPLGGYVKMLDEREGEVLPEETHRAFNNKPLQQRTLIVLAGPVFNFIFAIVAYWCMFMIGVHGLRPLVGEVEPGSIASVAGLGPDYEIVAVDGTATATWTMVADAMIDKIISGEPVSISIRQEHGIERETMLDISGISIDDLADSSLLEKIGITPRQFMVPAIVGEVHPGEAAARAGLRAGDKILAAGDMAITGWKQWVEVVQNNPETLLETEIERNGSIFKLDIIPAAKKNDDGKVIGFIGAANLPPEGMFAVESYTILPAFVRAVEKTWDMSVLTLRMLGKIITGQASYKNLSGPISIAQYAGDSAERGIAPFLWFLAIVSISLGVLNLLPVPVLDGGHLLYYLIEFIKGGPVPESAQIVGQQIGLILLLSLMVLVFYNDIVRLL